MTVSQVVMVPVFCRFCCHVRSSFFSVDVSQHWPLTLL